MLLEACCWYQPAVCCPADCWCCCRCCTEPHSQLLHPFQVFKSYLNQWDRWNSLNYLKNGMVMIQPAGNTDRSKYK